MKDKVMSADQAAALVTSGIHLGVGAGMEMNPMPVVREVIRNKVTGLTLTPLLTGGYVADLLIGAGCVDEIQFPQVVMDEFGLAPNFRKRAESGRLAMRESMCPVLLAGLQAGAHGLPFTPRSWRTEYGIHGYSEGICDHDRSVQRRRLRGRPGGQA